MVPIRPVVAALGTPVVERVVHALAPQDLGQLIRRPAVLERTVPGDDTDVAARQILVHPGIAQVGEIVDGVVEIEVVVVHPTHRAAHVVDTRERKASLDRIGVFEERIRRVKRAERCAHRGHRDQALAVMVDERDHFLPDVGVVAAQHPAAMEGMRLLVEQPFAGHRSHREDLEPAAVDERRQRPDHALPLVFPLVAQAGREDQHRRSEVAEDRHSHFPSQTGRVPTMMFAMHQSQLISLGFRTHGLKPVASVRGPR